MDSNFATMVPVSTEEVTLAYKNFSFATISFSTAKPTDILMILLPREKSDLPFIDDSVDEATYAAAQLAAKTALEAQIKDLVNAELVSGLQIVWNEGANIYEVECRATAIKVVLHRIATSGASAAATDGKAGVDMKLPQLKWNSANNTWTIGDGVWAAAGAAKDHGVVRVFRKGASAFPGMCNFGYLLSDIRYGNFP
jgi:hypothetical protein